MCVCVCVGGGGGGGSEGTIRTEGLRKTQQQHHSTIVTKIKTTKTKIK